MFGARTFARTFSATARALIRWTGFDRSNLPEQYRQAVEKFTAPGGSAEQVGVICPVESVYISRITTAITESMLILAAETGSNRICAHQVHDSDSRLRESQSLTSSLEPETTIQFISPNIIQVTRLGSSAQESKAQMAAAPAIFIRTEAEQRRKGDEPR